MVWLRASGRRKRWEAESKRRNGRAVVARHDSDGVGIEEYIIAWDAE
jgi:hypothetical protein